MITQQEYDEAMDKRLTLLMDVRELEQEINE